MNISVIFDIDGTLIKSMKFDSELYIQAVEETLGKVRIHDDWGKYKHVTDTGILKEIIRDNNIENSLLNHRLVRERFGLLVKNFLTSNPCHAVEGAIDFVNRFSSIRNVQIGIATGGWGHTARMKLASAGFDISDITLFSSDDSETREEIMLMCRNAISNQVDNTIYIGDAIWDLSASTNLNWDFIAIGERLIGQTAYCITNFNLNHWRAIFREQVKANGIKPDSSVHTLLDRLI